MVVRPRLRTQARRSRAAPSAARPACARPRRRAPSAAPHESAGCRTPPVLGMDLRDLLRQPRVGELPVRRRASRPPPRNGKRRGTPGGWRHDTIAPARTRRTPERRRALLRRPYLEEQLLSTAYRVTRESFRDRARMLGDDGYDIVERARADRWSAIPSWRRDGWDLGAWPLVVTDNRTTDNRTTGQPARHTSSRTTRPMLERVLVRDDIRGETTRVPNVQRPGRPRRSRVARLSYGRTYEVGSCARTSGCISRRLSRRDRSTYRRGHAQPAEGSATGTFADHAPSPDTAKGRPVDSLCRESLDELPSSLIVPGGDTAPHP